MARGYSGIRIAVVQTFTAENAAGIMLLPRIGQGEG